LRLEPKTFGEDSESFRLTSFLREIQRMEKIHARLDGLRIFRWQRAWEDKQSEDG